ESSFRPGNRNTALSRERWNASSASSIRPNGKSPNASAPSAEQGITYTSSGVTSAGSVTMLLFSGPRQRRAERAIGSSSSAAVDSPSTSPDASSRGSAASHFLNNPIGTGTASDDEGGTR